MIWILAVSVCGTALSASAENTQTGGALTAAQTEQTTTLSDTETDADTAAELELFLPESYEQYLDLEDPSDFAINENYIAIASRQDSNSVIYVYDKAKQNYRVLNIDGQSPKSLNFYTKGVTTYLYFVLSGNNVFRVNLSEDNFVQEKIEGFACFSLIILGETIYSSRTQGDATIYRSSVDSPTDTDQIKIVIDGETKDSIENCNKPIFTIFADKVYLAANNDIYIYNGTNFIWQGETVNIIDSFAIYAADPSLSLSFYYTASNNSLYKKASGENEKKLFGDADYFSDLGYFDGKSFVLNLQNNSVVQLKDDSTANYEIGKYSDRSNRIGQGASDVSLNDHFLLIADKGNDRVLIADTQSGEFREVKVTNPDFVCAGENDFIVSDSHYLYLYSYEGQTEIKEFPSGTFGGTIADCTYSYGKYYVVGSGTNANGVIEKGADGEYRYTASTLSTPFTSITSDIFGNIYVLTGTSVMQYTDFLNGSGATPAFYAPPSTIRIISDYKGKMYAATADGLYLLDKVNYKKIFSSDSLSTLVFSELPFEIFSFTFGFESGDVYILSDGFIVRAQLGTNAPASLNSIDADGLYDIMYNAVLDSGSAEDLLVNVPAGSVLLAAGSGITSSTAVFPYAGYERTDEARAGVRVCELDAGTVVAFYEYIPAQSAGAPPTRTYSLCLVLKNDSLPLESLAGYTAAETPFAGYTTHAIGLYRFPLLQTGGSAVYSGGTQLEHTQMVTVLGTISYSVASDAEGYGLDFEYYFVRVGSGDSAVYGFVPKNYIIDYYAPSSWDGEEFTFRYVRRGEEITLQNGGEPITLGGDTRVKVYGEPDENNMVNVTYTDADGNVWSGLVNADLLYEATPSVLIVLVIVLVVTAAVIVSTCYLILRKQPTLQ